MPLLGADVEATELAALRRRILGASPELDEQKVDALIEAATARFSAAKIRQFVPIFVERTVRELLADRVKIDRSHHDQP